MSSLGSLIRLHRWQLDEHRKHVAELETLAEKFKGELTRLEDEELLEQQVAGASHEASYAYSSYAQTVIGRRTRLAKSLADAEDQILKARDDLAGAFEEVKRYEIAAANRLLAQARQIAKVEQTENDEIAGEIYRRQPARRNAP